MLALITSFVTILIMWVSHHNMFTYIRKADTLLLFLNGLLLFFVVLTPFTTLLIANHVSLGKTSDAVTAAAVYSGDFLLLGLVWTVAGVYSFRNELVPGREANRRYFVGPISYAVAFGLAFVYPLASVVLILLVDAYFAVYANSFGREPVSESNR